MKPILLVNTKSEKKNWQHFQIQNSKNFYWITFVRKNVDHTIMPYKYDIFSEADIQDP